MGKMVNDFGKKILVIGAGLIGTYTTKEMEERGYNIYATILNKKEIPPFEKRTGFSRRKDEYKIGPVCFRDYTNGVRLGEFNIFEEYGEKSAFRSLIEGFSENNIDIDSIVNSINLGTILGLKAYGGELGTRDIFNFCCDINSSLTELAKKQGNIIKYLTVGTTGTGGIGLEKLEITHDMDDTKSQIPPPIIEIPPRIIEKSRCASEVLNFFRDFRQSNPFVNYIGIVPASAVVDTTVFEGPVPLYGGYRKFYGKGNIPLISTKGENKGVIETHYFSFGEDGPHTFYDAQQLQMFMGFTSAYRIAEIIADELEGIGPNNYNVLTTGSTIPAMSDYLIKIMEKKGNQGEIPSLSPIGPFDISKLSFTLDLLSKNGYKTLSSLEKIDIDAAERKIMNYLMSNSEYTERAISLGVEFDLNNKKIKGIVSRGTVSRGTIKEAKEIASEFESFMEESEIFSEFMDLYRKGGKLYLEDINGILSAFPFAKTMRKRRHL